jgi:hypothetical protein
MSNQTTTSKPGGRRGLTIGLAGGLLAGTAAGLVFGVPGLSSASSDAASAPAALVQQTDETPTDDDIRPDPGVGLREMLQALVDDGTLTSEQADAVTAYLVENRPERGERGVDGMLVV